jgi:TonB family protein
LAALLCPAPVFGQQGLDSATLERVGSIALLVTRASDPATAALVQTAVRDEHPAVRAAAARVTLAVSVRSALPALRAALATEERLDAIREQAWALAALDPSAEADAVLFAAAERLGAEAVDPLLEGLGAGRGAALAAQWERVRRVATTPRHWRALLRGLKSRGPAGLEPLAPALLRDGSPDVWEAYLESLTSTGRPLDQGLLTVALASSSAAMRIATLWHWASAGERAPVSLLDGLPPTPGAAEAFPRELVRRSLGQKAEDSVATIRDLAKDQEAVTRLRTSTALRQSLGLLSNAERQELGRVVFGDPKKFPKEEVLRIGALRGAVRAPETPLRTVGPFPPDFLAGVIRSTGCRPEAGTTRDGWAEVVFREDGRLARVAFGPGAEGDGCPMATRVLALNTLGSRRPGETELLYVPLHERILACQAPAAPVESRRDPAKIGGVIQEPKKTRNVNPVFPEFAKQHRIQGLVVVEAIIATTGCVERLELLQGVQAALDLEAMRAVSRWSYTPTTLDGVPVPVVMTVTINFTLR